MKRDVIKDIENGKFSKRDSIADLQVYQLEGVTYELPINSTPKLRQYFATAVLAYKNDAKFEEVLSFQEIEKYQDEYWLDNELVVRYLIAMGIDFMINVTNDMYNTISSKKCKLHAGEIAYFNTMSRLRESFKSVIILCDRGFYIEMMPILRLIYEQLCWACYSMDESDENKLNTNWKTKNTRYLKEKLGDQYGRIYDQLSKESHMAIPEMGKYLEFDQENSIISVKGRSGKKSKEETENIVLLYKIYLDVFECGIKHFCEKEDLNYYTELLVSQKNLAEKMKDVCEGKENLELHIRDRV